MNIKKITKIEKILILIAFFLIIFLARILLLNISSSNAAIPGDIDGNGTVNIVDLDLFAQAYGKSAGQPGFNPAADFFQDSRINSADLFILVENYGRTEPSVSPTRTPTVIVNPTRTNTPTPTRTRTPTPSTIITNPPPSPPTGQGFWISRAEIAQLPMSGSAWTNLRSAAYGSWSTPDLKNQDNKFGLNVLAGALVYARTNDSSLRTKTKDGIMAAKRTMDASSEWQTQNGALSLGRQLGIFAIAADIIDLKNYDTTADSEFRSWLSIIRRTNVGTHGRWKNLTFTCENSANNWGTFACPSRLAASLYLGDTADVQRVANIMRAYFGERQYYPADAPGENGYFQITSGGASGAWYCTNLSTWTAINPPCTKLGINIDGALVDDASRGGSCCTLQGLSGGGFGYSWEALQGLFVSTELLLRTGRFGNPYLWSNSALKRAMSHMQRQGWNAGSVSLYVPWMANKRYGTNYPTTPTGSGRIMSWTDWTHQ